MKKYIIPILIFLVMAGGLSRRFNLPHDQKEKIKVHTFAELPVVYGGRVKPYHTLARNFHRAIAERDTFYDLEGKKSDPIIWLLDVISGEHKRSLKHKIFRIDNLEVLDLLGLERRKRYRYAFEEFVDNVPKLEEAASKIYKIDADKRTAYEKKILLVTRKIDLFQILAQSHYPQYAKTSAEYVEYSRLNKGFEQAGLPLPIPPLKNDQSEWRPFMSSFLDYASGDRKVNTEKGEEIIRNLALLLNAYRENDAKEFDQYLKLYQRDLKTIKGIQQKRISSRINELTQELSQLDKLSLEEQKSRQAEIHSELGRLNKQHELWFANIEKMHTERLFNHSDPFFLAWLTTIFVLVITVFGWLATNIKKTFSEQFRLTSMSFMILALALASYGMLARYIISGYPPITNLFSTAIFIAWSSMALGLFIEFFFKKGLGNAIGSIIGFITLIIAYFLAGDGDTLEMMRAVLDTKFWLMIHVTIINFGYMGAFFAGGLGVITIIGRLIPALQDRGFQRSLQKMTYGVICYALFMSFAGTILGGLWADDSWGRFWGWDPKENGALIIVLWNTLILHAAWGRMIRERGLAVLAVFGNVLTAWSWFGVNQLSIGLHSYGFTEDGRTWLIRFVISQLIIMALALIPIAQKTNK